MLAASMATDVSGVKFCPFCEVPVPVVLSVGMPASSRVGALSLLKEV